MNRIREYLSELNCPEPEIKNIEQKIAALNALSDDLPVYIIHDCIQNHVVYMSPKGLEGLDVTLEAVRAMGDQYYQLFFNPDDAAAYLSHWNSFLADNNNLGRWFTFFQQVKAQGADLVWFLSVSKVIALDIDSKPLLSLTLALKLNQYLPIIPKLDRLVEENAYFNEKVRLFLRLTKREKEILAIMAKGTALQKVAEELHISEDTLRTHRKNIKKKLALKNDIEILKFAQAFNLS